MKCKLDVREDYTEWEEVERQKILESKDSAQIVINRYKNLWVKVIKRAINDIALMKINIPAHKKKLYYYRLMRNKTDKDKKKYIELKIEYDKMIHIQQTAYEFLFDKNHRIIWDDYKVKIKCQCCEAEWTSYISEAAGKTSQCINCKNKINKKYVYYRITEEYITKTISLDDLLMICGIENGNLFRKKLEEDIKFKLKHPDKIED